ncbi:unnamed protein product [Hermetia illucens]|uniref:4-nitrophenylphosphatase n=2 Tax=Hermetia illucens TaxID=343691 RepID=A0A7R8V0R5_HERIL|nr:unnamed protein product [Hermetia illucens]
MPSSCSVRHILELSKFEKTKFLNSFDIVFCDCDGVIWDATTHKPLEAVGNGIKKLKEHGKKVVFLTNNSTRSEEDYAKQFQSVGLDIDLEDVVHPVRSIITYLRQIEFDGLIYCMATEAFKDSLRSAGFKVIDGPNKILEESFSELARNVFDKEPVRAVVVDVDINLSSSKMIRADVYLRHPACILIGGAADVKIPFGPANTIGPGAFLRILEQSSKRKALTFGKPGDELISHLKREFKVNEPKRVLLIGDILETDIVFGKMGGFQTMLVLTGCTKKEDMEVITNENEKPDYYADSVADFIEFFESIKEE